MSLTLKEVEKCFPHPQHAHIKAFREHGRLWVSCLDCGAQWAVNDTTDGLEFEQVSDGDDSCDDEWSEDEDKYCEECGAPLDDLVANDGLCEDCADKLHNPELYEEDDDE